MRPPPEAATERLFIHIGAPKTGTKYLQGLLWENRELLERHGVHLPGKRQRFHFAAGSDLIGDPGETYEDRVRTNHRAAVGCRDRTKNPKSHGAASHQLSACRANAHPIRRAVRTGH